MHAPIPETDERIGKLVVDAAFTVHKKLGAGLLENVYEVCFCHELDKRNLSFQRQASVPIVYEGITFHEGFRLDVLVEHRIICELKAVDKVLPVHTAQLLTYLRVRLKTSEYEPSDGSSNES